MSKKMKLLIVLIIAILVIGLFWGSMTLYRFSLMQKIYNTVKEYVIKDNYYLKTTVINQDKKIITEAYYRNGIGKLVAENGIYTWANGEKAYIIDEENKDLYNLKTENSIILVSNEMFASLYPIYSKSIIERFLFAGNPTNKIKDTKLEDRKCIMIKSNDGMVTKTIWITKNRSEIIKAKVEFSNGDIYDYEYELKFDTTKLKDIELPDISNYNVKGENNGEILDY